MKKVLTLPIIFFFFFSASAQQYECYSSSDEYDLQLCVKYINGTAVSVKYKGQTNEPSLVLVKKITDSAGKAPVEISLYNEVTRNKKIGTYTFYKTCRGYSVDYLRSNDKQLFRFDLNTRKCDMAEARVKPCF